MRRNWKMKIEIRKDRGDFWFWRIKARNGKILAHSESYSSKSQCVWTANEITRELWDADVEVIDE